MKSGRWRKGKIEGWTQKRAADFEAVARSTAILAAWGRDPAGSARRPARVREKSGQTSNSKRLYHVVLEQLTAKLFSILNSPFSKHQHLSHAETPRRGGRRNADGFKTNGLGTTPPKRSLGETMRRIARRVRHPRGCESQHTDYTPRIQRPRQTAIHLLVAEEWWSWLFFILHNTSPSLEQNRSATFFSVNALLQERCQHHNSKDIHRDSPP